MPNFGNRTTDKLSSISYVNPHKVINVQSRQFQIEHRCSDQLLSNLGFEVVMKWIALKYSEQ